MRLLLLSICAVTARAHSWLACVDYRCTTTAPSQPGDCTCNGYPRNWHTNKANSPFAADVGRDVRPGASPANGGLFCDPQKEPNPGAGSIDAYYTAEYPSATLTQGQTVRWRWPAKNHATVGIQRGVQVYLSTTAGQGDVFPTAATAADIYAEMDFSNCEPRQGGVDNADCQDEFVVRSDTPPGRYTMMWWWEFNAGEFYNTCADVTIVAATDGGGGGDSGGGVSSPPPPGASSDKIPAIGVLYGECQTNLDEHQAAAPGMADSTAYCLEEAAKTAAQYGQIEELDGRYSFDSWAQITSCDEFYAKMDEVCDKMADISSQGISALGGGGGGGGGSVGAGFIGFFCGIVAGVLLIKCVMPLMLSYGGSTPPPPAGAPPPKQGQPVQYYQEGGALPPPAPPHV